MGGGAGRLLVGGPKMRMVGRKIERKKKGKRGRMVLGIVVGLERGEERRRREDG